MIDDRFVILGSVIVAFGGLSYLIETVKGKVKPNKVSFLLCSFASLIVFTAQIKQGVTLLIALFTLVAGLEPLLIFIASFFNKDAKWKLTRFDLYCGALSIIGIILWQITKSGNIAIIFSIIADGLALLPTVVKSYNYPETESGWPYFTTAISAVITLLAVKSWSLASVGFTIYLLIICLAIYLLVQFKVGNYIKTVIAYPKRNQ